jgi:magnesium-transporting ATPase (P-type)
MVRIFLRSFESCIFGSDKFRYQPPMLDKDHSNTKNSQNTTLFLVSCYQYILAAIVLSVGPPFRQPMTQNRKSLERIFVSHTNNF